VRNLKRTARSPLLAQTLLLASCLGLVHAAAAALQDETSPASPASQHAESALTPPHESQPLESILQLAPLGDADADSAQSVSAQVDQLIGRGDQSADSILAIDLRLSAANLLLARHTEPALTRVLLRLPDQRDTDLAREALNQASAILSVVEKSLEAQHAAQDPRAAEAQLQYARLNAFERALQVITGSTAQEDQDSQAREAASDLAVLLEQDDPRIAESALLYYAILMNQSVGLDRVLTVLPNVAAPPRPQHTEYPFFARLLRCQLIADRGGYAVSLALLDDLEDRVDRWFTQPDQQLQALRSVAWVRYDVLRNWRDSLPGSAVAERQWCERAMLAVPEAHFRTQQTTLLRLGLAIPILVTAPEAVNAPPDPTPSHPAPPAP